MPRAIGTRRRATAADSLGHTSSSCPAPRSPQHRRPPSAQCARAHAAPEGEFGVNDMQYFATLSLPACRTFIASAPDALLAPGVDPSRLVEALARSTHAASRRRSPLRNLSGSCTGRRTWNGDGERCGQSWPRQCAAGAQCAPSPHAPLDSALIAPTETACG